MRRTTAIFALMFLATTTAAARAQQQQQQPSDDGFTALVEGTDPGQFTLVQIGPDTITIGEDGEVALSGRPNGYFATKDSYENYVLRFDWMYERPEDLRDDAAFDGNSGLLVHIEEPHKVWPKCVEAQLKNSDAGRLLAINGATIAGKQSAEARNAARSEAIKPVGQWNSQEVICRDGSIECRINGVLIDAGADASPRSGTIGWQSEGRPIRFRNLRIRPIE